MNTSLTIEKVSDITKTLIDEQIHLSQQIKTYNNGDTDKDKSILQLLNKELKDIQTVLLCLNKISSYKTDMLAIDSGATDIFTKGKKKRK